MDNLDELYTDLIMEHSMNSANKREIAHPTCSTLGHNPNCGDEIKLEVVVEGGRILDMAFSGHGCAISQSSTSIMIETLRGKTVEEAKKKSFCKTQLHLKTFQICPQELNAQCSLGTLLKTF